MHQTSCARDRLSLVLLLLVTVVCGCADQQGGALQQQRDETAGEPVEIEQYGSAVDYPKVEEFRQRFLARLFGDSSILSGMVAERIVAEPRDDRLGLVAMLSDQNRLMSVGDDSAIGRDFILKTGFVPCDIHDQQTEHHVLELHGKVLERKVVQRAEYGGGQIFEQKRVTLQVVIKQGADVFWTGNFDGQSRPPREVEEFQFGAQAHSADLEAVGRAADLAGQAFADHLQREFQSGEVLPTNSTTVPLLAKVVSAEYWPGQEVDQLRRTTFDEQVAKDALVADFYDAFELEQASQRQD